MSKKVEKLLQGKGGNYIFPFFWQHGETEEVLREYMQVIHDCGIGAVCVESRPHPDFCGEKWWQDMDVILDEAKKRDMKVWILDDSHFPTGYANGAMEQEPDELRRQSICCRITEAEGNTTVTISPEQLAHPDPFEKSMVENFMIQGELETFDDDRLLGVYAVRVEEGKACFSSPDGVIDLTGKEEADGLVWNAPEGKWKIYTLHLSRNFGYHRSYINMMNHTSCRVLLDTVYEPHFAHYEKYFGNTIAGFFSDEPEMGNGHMYNTDDAFGTMIDYPWSPELEEKLSESLGENNWSRLALLWENEADGDEKAKVRYTYMNTVTRLVQKDFSEQMGNWCREHGVEYIGHLIEDNDHHSRLGSSLGHYFRGLRGQDMAGIDDIGGQVLPQGENISYNRGLFAHRDGPFYHYVLGRLASSAAAIEPGKKGNSMCEIFGAYGWEEGVQLEKYLADHFMVRGVNHFVPHAFSAKDFPDPDCPPHFYAHGNNPQYRHFGALMQYMNRVCELISDGKEIVHTAILYDAESEWTGTCERMGRTAQILCDHQVGYHILPQDVFTEREFYHTKISEGKLQVHTQAYEILLVPPTEYVTNAFAEAVKELERAGVQVLFLEQKPAGICDAKDAEEKEEGLACLEDAKVVSYEMLETLVQGNREEHRGCEKLKHREDGVWFRKIQEIRLQPKDDRVRFLHYEHEDGSGVLYLVNEGNTTWKGTAALDEKLFENAGKVRTLYGYDAWENGTWPVSCEDHKVELVLEPRKSVLLILDVEQEIGETGTTEAKCREFFETGKNTEKSSESAVRILRDGWKRSICRSIDYPAFQEEKEISLPDHLEQEKPLFSGFVRYETEIELNNPEQALLEITDAAEGVEVFLNGTSLGIQVVPHYLYDLSKAAKTGKNHLCIEVATTLEREMSEAPSMMPGEKKEPQSRSGICGEVLLYEAK